MINKYFKFIITIAMVLCVLCSSFTVAFAAPEGTKESTTAENIEKPDEEKEEETKPGLIIGEPTTKPVETKPVTTKPAATKPETTKAEVTKPSATKPETTEPETEPQDEPVEKTTRQEKPTASKVPTTKRPKPVVQEPDEENDVNVDDNADNEADDVVAEPTPETPEETTLPEGSFYVYLERNNGQPRLKRILTEPGLVPEPQEPVREGYVFDGWYADAKFTKPWNFFSSIADDKTIIYAKWVSDGSVVVYDIKVSKTVGGTLEVNPVSASEGEPVIVTVLPDEGKRVVAGSLKINGKASDVFSFIMPAKDVVIEAEFEDIPESEMQEEEEKSILPFIIGAIIVVVAIVVVVIIILRRRSYDEFELDENGAIIIDDYDDDDWVDESIVIEDGFANGKIVRENVEPDFGEFESDDIE